MPNEQMSQEQVGAYLHMDLRELVKLASRGQIPCRKVGGRFVFRKGDVDHWIELRMGSLGKRRLARIEKGVSRHHGIEHEAKLVGPLVPAGGVAVPLVAKTRASVLRELVGLAGAAGMVHSPKHLLREVRRREELCSTALMPGVAFPHPRHPLPYDIEGSFVVVGLTPKGIGYGAADGGLTRLFFLICCKDDRTHLHVLARLSRMLHSSAAVDELMAAPGPDEMLRALGRLEAEAMKVTV